MTNQNVPSSDMPVGFESLKWDLDGWAMLTEGLVVRGHLRAILPGQDGSEYLVIQLTAGPVVARMADEEVTLDRGMVLGMGMRAGLDCLRNQVGSEVWIRCGEKGETRDGRPFWKFNVGFRPAPAPKGSFGKTPKADNSTPFD